MNEKSKQARNYIKQCTRKEFEVALYEAKLTPLQEKIIREHILEGKSVCAIAIAEHCSEMCIKKNLQCTYNSLSRYLICTHLLNKNEIIISEGERDVH